MIDVFLYHNNLNKDDFHTACVSSIASPQTLGLDTKHLLEDMACSNHCRCLHISQHIRNITFFQVSL